MEAEELQREANAMQEQLIRIRRVLHAHPETGFDLSNTKLLVKQELQDMGYQPIDCGRSGLFVLAGGKRPGKTFLLRADMDALPVREETKLDFASVNGNMHACGHDLHTTMLLGAARLLKKYEENIEGTVKLMFQPAEEILEGARDMIENGILENPRVDGAFMIHVMTDVPLAPGTVVIPSKGVSAPAADMFTITIFGKGCHGSSPDEGVDPLNVAAHILLAMQEIPSRELAIQDEAVLTIGTMHGGMAPNVIPDTVAMGGSLRAYDEQIREFIKKRLKEITAGVAQTFRAEAEVVFASGCPTLINEEGMVEHAVRCARELLGQENVLSAGQLQGAGKKSGGSEDFSYISQKVPSVMAALAAGQADQGHGYPLHHPRVTFDEEVLATGSVLYAYMAMQWLVEQKDR
ncbi:MAG: M20 metallopeptidase family protein [Lachnospiraceae bacterium]